MKRKALCISVFLLCNLHAYSMPWSDNKKQIEQQLKNGKVKSIDSMKDFLTKQGRTADFYNPVLFVTLDNGVEGVFKPDSEEQDMYGEVAAYEASKLTKLDVVPPTIIRNLQGKKGSFQLYVKNTPVSLKDFETEWKKISATIKGNCVAFQFVFGQWDRSEGNFLFVTDNNQEEPKLLLIDNAGMVQSQQADIEKEGVFVRKAYSDKRHDSWDTPFPFDAVQEVSFENIQHHPDLKDFDLSANAFKFLKTSGKPLRFIIWRNSLWFQPYSDKPFKINEISKTFLESLKQLTKENLEMIWKHYPKSWTAKRKSDIFSGIFHRRDQLLQYVEHHKVIIR